MGPEPESIMRPEILFPLFADLETLPGLGPKMARLVARAVGGTHVKDVLFHAPSGVIDRSARPGVTEAQNGAIATFEIMIEKHMPPERGSKRPYRVRASDDTGFLTLAWFHARPDWLIRQLPEGRRRIVSGRVERFGDEIQMLHPDHILDPAKADEMPLVEPVWPLTAELSPKTMGKAILAALERAPALPEWQDPAVLARHAWPAWKAALEAAHHPQSPADLEPSAKPRERLAYDELLAHQLALRLARAQRRASPGRALSGDGAKVRAVLAAAPFTPTACQTRAFAEIEADMAAPARMTRLIHGDVGAGKTFVAALAAARATEAGVQTAVLAPTEILARQHAVAFDRFLRPAGVTVETLTGRDKGARRADILARLASGAIDVLCGTHALFQEGVDFHDLGLVVVDEQHRFGVSDRARMGAKGARPDTLVMSATPIPRTLALAVYGDLDVSELPDKPAGRLPIATSAAPMERLDEVVQAVQRACARGERVYWVCPLVEESELVDLTAAEDRLADLRARTRLKLGLVHGRMKPAEKEAAAEAFRAGDIQVLVATTVIEVGIDSPDATVMIIEHAERFGLAQLHQLRGRVGRSDKASACLLLYQGPLGETARARLDILRETEDGFRIAEEDLRLRGSGDLLGLKQTGFPRFRFADVSRQQDLLRMAADEAHLIAERSPDLEGPRGEALRTLLYLHERDAGVRLLRGG
jgi:ATP-dependent DNA helicase RecG